MSSVKPDISEFSPQERRARRKNRLFVTSNILLMLSVIVALATNRYADGYSAFYVILLFLVCTFPIIYYSNFRGKGSLLMVFLGYYFAIFALKDLVGLLSYTPLPPRPAGMSGAEVAILAGAMCFIAGYALAAQFTRGGRGAVLGREWSPKSLVVTGIICWGVGFYITAVWQFGVGDFYSGAKINTTVGGFTSLLRFLQPVGTLLLIYTFLTSRSKAALLLLLATMLLDFGLGFVGDSKELALRAPILYIISVLLLRERIPAAEIVVFVVVASITFNLFAAYRTDIHMRHQSRIEAFKDLGSKLDSIAGEDKPLAERLQHGRDYFVDRISLKHHVELIVARVGKDVEYLKGHTLQPMLFAFIPRFVLPDKRDSSQAGRIFNREFIGSTSNTYVSMSQLGELYWNFGWTGLIAGMLIVGMVMGWAAALFRLDTFPTAIKYLLLLMTIYLLSLRFSGAMAKTYIIWARLGVLLLLIHFFMPKVMPAGISKVLPKIMRPPLDVQPNSRQGRQADDRDVS